MPREDWRGEGRRDDFGQADYSRDYGYDPRRRIGYRVAGEALHGDDYGQADYSDDYRFDPRSGRAYRRFSDDDPTAAVAERRTFAGSRRRGASDRVLWAVIVERLEDERRLDLRDVEVTVHDGEVTLHGSVRRKEDKRRIEDIADIDGVRNVQNNLRVRERHWF